MTTTLVRGGLRSLGRNLLRPAVASSSVLLSESTAAVPVFMQCRAFSSKFGAGEIAAFRHLPPAVLDNFYSRPLESVTQKELEAHPSYEDLDTGGMMSGKDFAAGDDRIAQWQERRFKSLKLKHFVAEVKRVVHVNKKGRLSSMSALVVVGNGNGSAGFAHAKSDTVKSAIEKAKYKAMNAVTTVERYDHRTILLPVDGKYGASKLRMRPATDGYGLVCHHTVMEICKLVGISDISITHLGSRNRLNVVRAAFECFEQLPSMKEYCLNNRLNAVDFRRIMSRHVMFAPRECVDSRKRQIDVRFKERKKYALDNLQ